MNAKYSLSDWDSERYVDQLLFENDDQSIACPTYDSEPDLLLSRVRQHYMKHMVKLLSVNYENNQRLLNKNIYLPSGIWRCAKIIEMKAAQSSMVIQLYRAHILSVIKEVKKDTEKGKLYSSLLECLRTPPYDKKTQTSIGTSSECNCECYCSDNKKRRKKSLPNTDKLTALLQNNKNTSVNLTQYQIPVTLNMQTPEPVSKAALNMQTTTPEPISNTLNKTSISSQYAPHVNLVNQSEITDKPRTVEDNLEGLMTPTPRINMTPVHMGNNSDDVMMQLEKLFHTDQNDDDLFDATFNDIPKSSSNKDQNDLLPLEESMTKIHESVVTPINHGNDLVIENHAQQIRSLDERLATLTGMLINNESNMSENKEDKKNKRVLKEKEIKKKKIVSKWHCEEYFLKKSLLETLYQIGDTNRKKLAKIKTMFLELFGEDDDDDEDILSPIEDSPHLILSCKTRISLWVLTTLTPYYGMGRIRGKNLFKSVVKYLINLIFKCKQYPDKDEVISFVQDFIQSHAIITCEADYRDIIDNVKQAPYTFA